MGQTQNPRTIAPRSQASSLVRHGRRRPAIQLSESAPYCSCVWRAGKLSCCWAPCVATAARCVARNTCNSRQPAVAAAWRTRPYASASPELRDHATGHLTRSPQCRRRSAATFRVWVQRRLAGLSFSLDVSWLWPADEPRPVCADPGTLSGGLTHVCRTLTHFLQRFIMKTHRFEQLIELPQASAGSMFWFRRKTFVGSYRLLTSRNRA